MAARIDWAAAAETEFDSHGNMHSAVKIDLVGMAVGDPCTDTQAQKQSMDMLWYAHKNGLVQDNEYDFLVNKCGASMPSDRMAGEWVADKSARVVPSKPTRPKLLSTSANCTAAMRRYLVASSKGISQSWDHAFINELSFYSPAAEFRFDIPGTLNYHTAKWMMAHGALVEPTETDVRRINRMVRALQQQQQQAGSALRIEG